MQPGNPPQPEVLSMTLEPLLFKDIQIALLTQRLTLLQAQEAVAQADRQLKAALSAAGLDPNKRYNLDERTFTATMLPV